VAAVPENETSNGDQKIAPPLIRTSRETNIYTRQGREGSEISSRDSRSH
jgi:hypothetical protein